MLAVTSTLLAARAQNIRQMTEIPRTTGSAEVPGAPGIGSRVERMRTPLPPVAAVVGFVDAINRGDVERLCSLMTEDHRLHVLDETPLAGRAANRQAWIGYASAYPDYVIYPSRIVDRGAEVFVLGATTGSHLGLTDEEERRLGVIWRAVVRDGALSVWQVIEDGPDNRARYGLDAH